MTTTTRRPPSKPRSRYAVSRPPAQTDSWIPGWLRGEDLLGLGLVLGLGVTGYMLYRQSKADNVLFKSPRGPHAWLNHSTPLNDGDTDGA